MDASFGQSASLANVSSEELAERVQGVMRRVYLWMTLGLVVTALSAFAVMQTEALFMLVARNVWWFIIGEFVLVLGLTFTLNRLPLPVALGGFFLYAAVNGATLSIVILAYTASQVLAAFVSTACVFGAMTLVGYTTKMDLTKLGGFLTMALIGVILGSIINIFLASDGLDWILTFLGIAIFIGLTAYHTQRIKTMTAVALTQGGNVSVETTVGVYGALILYLDFINLFLRILRLFGRRR